jgi:hypothetical protein
MKTVTFQDQIGRIIIGNQVGETETTLTVDDPKVIHVEMQQGGTVQVHVIPIFFAELIDNIAENGNEWVYNKSNIVMGDVKVSADLIARSESINKPVEKVETGDKVISITDVD